MDFKGSNWTKFIDLEVCRATLKISGERDLNSIIIREKEKDLLLTV